MELDHDERATSGSPVSAPPASSSTGSEPQTREVMPLPARSLTEIAADEDEDDKDLGDVSVRRGEGDDAEGGDDDEEEQGGKDEGEDDEEEDEEEEEDRPLKKKQRRRVRNGNQFLDIEADVDENEDEEEEEGEDGFVALDNFIENPRDKQRNAAVPGVPYDDDDVNDGDDGDGDASHRLLDRKELARKNRDAEAEAASYKDRYAKARYDDEGADEWGPKALLMPGVNDPSIWGVKCKIGRERELVMSISRKAAVLAASSNAAPLQIISAFNRDSIKGFLYVEAHSESHVRTATNGLIGIYSMSEGGVFLVDIEEMPDLLKTKQKKVEIVAGGWARIKRGKYAGDLAQIVAVLENGEDAVLRFIPRIDLTPKDDVLVTGPDGKKRKKGAGTPLAFRPPQRFFASDEVGKVYGEKEVSRRQGNYTFRGDTYKKGYCEKEIRLTGLTLDDVQPTLDELTRFLGHHQDGAGGEDGSGFDLSHLVEAGRKAAKNILQPGDHIEVFEGDQKGIYGTVDAIFNDILTITPHADLELVGTKVEVQSKSVRKRFQAGDHIKVMNGTNADETGLVVKVLNNDLTFLSDLSLQEVTVFSKDVREAAEVGSGVNTIGNYQLHDLVQLDSSTTGVIFKVERDMFRILDQFGNVRSLKPTQIGIKVDSRFAVAVDQDGYNISPNDSMKEVAAGGIDGRRGRVLHVHRGIYAFLHNRDLVEDGGVFVVRARQLVSDTPKGSKQVGQGLNPERFAAPAPVVNAGSNMRADGRIHRKVAITRGNHKGYSGIIKDVTGMIARVELHTNAKIVTLPIGDLKEQRPDGTLFPLVERPGFGGGFGGGGGEGRDSGYGARPAFNRESSVISIASNSSSLAPGRTPFPSYGGRTPATNYSGGRTPAPSYSGGRTPAPQYSGGRTPAPSSGASGSWDASSRTPASSSGDSSGAWNAGSRTPALASSSSDSWNPSSRTPHPDRLASHSNAWDASSRTPHVATSYSDGNDSRSGGRTPAHSIKSSYSGRDDRGEGTSNQGYSSGSGVYGEGSYDAPASGSGSGSNNYSGYQAKTPYDTVATPGGYGSAPTPGAYGAPTPAAYGGAPTPAAYSSAPSPGSNYSVATPSGYTAPTPYGAATPYGAPTPYGQTPGAYATPAANAYPSQTPGNYVGAATTAAPHEDYVQRQQQQTRLPSDWNIKGLRVLFIQSQFQNGRLDGQTGMIIAAQDGLSTVRLDSTMDEVPSVPNVALKPMAPTRAGQVVIILAGADRGLRGTMSAHDGDTSMLSNMQGSRKSTTANLVFETAILGLEE